MTVKEAMSKNLKKVPSWISVVEAAKVMHQNMVGSVLVEENNRIIGIMTERDILRHIATGSRPCAETQVKQIMNQKLITIDLNAPLEEAGELMRKHKVRRISVMEKGKIVGIISARDLAERMKFSIAKRLQEYGRPDFGR